MKKYIFVTGGVCSSLGKGLASSSIGSLLELHGYTVCMIKIDPYLNVDAGTMNPYQHGEVYITDDGAETDLDLGHYFRFTSAQLSRQNSITTGQVYQEIINEERKGQYLGRTVQIIPHVTDRIKKKITDTAADTNADITIIEIGGTVGDIESYPFLETARQLIHEEKWENILSIHLILLPELANGELKTKPGQHSVRELREAGIHPDILLCRSELPLPGDIRQKIALLSSVHLNSVISAHNIQKSLYEIPTMYKEQDLDNIILRRLHLDIRNEKKSNHWHDIVDIINNTTEEITVALLGKYVEQNDTYMSVIESLEHGAIANKCSLIIEKIDAMDFNNHSNPDTILEGVDAVLIPGGFGARGVEGIINGMRYIREHKIPCLAICLGMQVMIIEFARSVLGITDAHSTEFEDDCSEPVVCLLEEQQRIKYYGASMRLGLSNIQLSEGSLIQKIYQQENIAERHRHRYEINDAYSDRLEAAGLRIAGRDDKSNFIEAVEWQNHPWGVGVQFHPELRSRPIDVHPLFESFIAAAVEKKKTGT